MSFLLSKLHEMETLKGTYVSLLVYDLEFKADGWF